MCGIFGVIGSEEAAGEDEGEADGQRRQPQPGRLPRARALVGVVVGGGVCDRHVRGIVAQGVRI